MTEKKTDIKDQAKASIKKQETTNAVTDIVAAKETYLTLIEGNKAQIQRALSKQVDVDRFVRAALTAISKNPALKKCSPRSILGCIIQAGQLDLEIGTSLHHACMIPFKGEAQFIVEYQGYIELILRTGKVNSVYAQVVKREDFFDYEYGTSPFLRHKPPKEGDRGDTIAVYAIAEMTSGSKIFEVMSKDQVDRIRAQAPGKDQEPWVKHYDEKARVTAIRRLQKYLPKSNQMAIAERLHDLGETGTPQGLDVTRITPDGEMPLPDIKTDATTATDASFVDVPKAVADTKPAGPSPVMEQPTSPAVQAAVDALRPGTPAKKEPHPQVELPLQPGDTPATIAPQGDPAVLKKYMDIVWAAKTKPELNRALIEVAKAYNSKEIVNTQYADLSDAIRVKMDGLKQTKSRNS